MSSGNFGAGPSSGKNIQGAPPAKRAKIKRFLDSWRRIPEFADWLQAVKGDDEKAYCLFCRKYLKCGKSEFYKHSSTKVHVRRAALATEGGVLLAPEPLVDNAHRAAVKSAENRLSNFFAEFNFDSETVSHMEPLIKQCFKDSRIAQDTTLGRTNRATITNSCFGKRELDNLVEILQTQKFSVLVDESTDIGEAISLCVLVQFVSPDTGKVVTELLELVELDTKNCSVENVYDAFKSCLDSKGIPVTNIVGAASHNPSVTTETRNSFMTRLESDSPGLVVLNCICHSPALIAGKACAALPRSCEDLISSVATYESGSTRVSAALREFQEFLDMEKPKLLKSSDVRWLSIQKCVVRLLDNWDTLKTHFALAVKEDRLKSADIILASLNNEVVRAYMLFLKYVLNFFNSFAALYRSKKILIHKLTEHSRRLVLQFGQNFLKPEVLNELTSGTLNVNRPRNFLALDQIVLGPECEKTLRGIPEVEAKEIRQNCLRFYTTAVSEMASRLPLDDSLLNNLQFLDPNVALSIEARGRVRDLSAVAQRFGMFDISKLAFEWNSLPSTYGDEKKKSLLALEVDSFWKEIAKTENLLDEKMFPTLGQIAEIVLSLPHSNAEAERIFSVVTDVRTKKLNNTSHECLDTVCQIRSACNIEHVNCNTFEIDIEDMKIDGSGNLYTP